VRIGTAGQLTSTIAEDGYTFVHAPEMRELLAATGALSDWSAFAASWNDLELDRYMADGGRYRRRRHAVYAASAAGTIVRGPHQPHYQSRDYNALNGGIARWFAPVETAIGSGGTMSTILASSRAVFESLTGRCGWHVEVHQFRIAARPGEEGRPTPEGVHRDGVDYVLVMLIERHNIASGTTTVHEVQGRQLGAFTLTVPLDAALLDDTRVAHGVTPIMPVDPAEPSYRDVLVVTWKRIQPRPLAAERSARV
jgi:hypothetical protein